MKGRREEFEAAEGGEAEAEELASAPPESDPEYRRRRRPVPVRQARGAAAAHFLRRRWKPVLATGLGLAVAATVYGLAVESSWFVLAGSGQIAIVGARQTDRARILDVFASDLGRNIFFIPLETRRQAITAIPWVRTAEVLRLWPARLQVDIQERVPVAYARVGDQLRLVDASGVVLDPARSGSFDFPVLTGLAAVAGPGANAPEALAQRQAQMKLYTAMRSELDQNGAHSSRDFSEIDLGDAGDVQARVSVPGGAAGEAASTVLIHFGGAHFGARYQLFQSQIAGWRQKYPDMVSVDLRYDGEAIVDPGKPPAAAKPTTAKPTAGKTAPAAKKAAAGRGKR